MIGGTGASLLAGLLSTLSPCVLPLVPVVLATAASKHRMGPAALAAGLAVSFVGIGLFIATVGFAIGLDEGVFRQLSAVMLILFGSLLMVPPLGTWVALAAGPVGDLAHNRLGQISGEGGIGQFLVGLLLGLVWTPCVGPTLGAASVMAAQGRNLGEVALTMAFFGIGAALPLLLLGFLSREALMRWRGKLASSGAGAKVILGAVLAASGIVILAGVDRELQTLLVDASPQWLTDLTTLY